MNAIAKAVLEACLRGSLGLKLQDVKDQNATYARFLKDSLKNRETYYVLYHTPSHLNYRKMVSRNINNNNVGFHINIEHYTGEVLKEEMPVII